MLQKYNVWTVARVFFDEPIQKHRLREISRKASLAHTSVKKHLQTLKKFEIIKEEKELQGNRKYPVYKSLHENENYKFYKKQDIIFRIKQTKIVEQLEKEFSPNCIILFGSASKGEDTEESDIDIYIEAEEKELNLKKYEKKFNRKIQLHIKPKLENYPEELKKNIINGNILYGYLEI